MRTLIIKRHKSGIACLAKMKVYIECHENYETVIAGVPCVKLGNLRNGEEARFYVPEESLKVFIIADKLSKNMSNDFYQLPEGSDDVYLSGRNKYNPLNGNAFRFDGETTEEMKRNRKRSKVKFAIFLAICFVVGIVIGLIKGLTDTAEPLDFEHELYTVTLTDDFVEVEDVDDCIACYSDGAAAVFVDYVQIDNFEPYDDFGATMLIDLIEGLEFEEVVTEGKLSYCMYESQSDSGDTCYYLTAVVIADSGYLIFDFGVDALSASYYYEEFPKYAKSIALK